VRFQTFLELRAAKVITSPTRLYLIMDLLKAKIFLDKINREFARMSKDPDNVARIDVDITLSYVRELYDAFLSDSVAAPAPVAPARKPAPPAPPPVAVVEAPPPPPPVVVAPPPPPVVVAPPPPVVVAPPPPPPPVVVEAPPPPPVVVAPPPPVVVEAPPPPPVVVEAPKPKPVQVTSVSADDAEQLFEYKEAREMSEKLSETPISDLKRAIAINDRMLLTRELFGGDSARFEAALVMLNGFTGFEQAKAFMISDLIGTNGWLDNKRIEAAKGFIRLVRRRYK
jgi:hypothetical protein